MKQTARASTRNLQLRQDLMIQMLMYHQAVLQRRLCERLKNWDMAREIALMQLIYNCCPFANNHGNKSLAWNEITANINSIKQTHLHPLTAKDARARKNLLFKKLNLVVNKDNERFLPVSNPHIPENLQRLVYDVYTAISIATYGRENLSSDDNSSDSVSDSDSDISYGRKNSQSASTTNESVSLLKQQLDILQQQQHTNNLVLEELKKISWSNAVLAESNQAIADSNKAIAKSNSALAKSLSTIADSISAFVESYKNNK
ncbi:hypothetical protein PHYBLDRAFT_143809 [Phycomyces blakesleeanus NRRL 1555(-)]|uniref:Uncharacterized protein n=1 Tax=Phycomyces blakesleeanus (strain ATCC 8743b / DSM 1359 / FGSC 10004 / NBRC 33097 / NRRL 1555) TaxID=763407 RepID=A0A162UIV4_PHYB8|nr:hypothetical protein PHYBLDRAFT_143809 [Phycomyces blakesleeanus NRRL 1555(-)]OAD75563.1 hypothetical protein PHYBLDRAFT_143809 [Phycomyces blakesleeanus NRRL 1555(-)]|eukprot:XP_018293603.1 hypothetical protein PHYBLDRAFT_143809 [Phycomyces blakesleeanus NRRL 1555(-)]